MSELKPCPFCESEDVHNIQCVEITCNTCEIEIPFKVWNNRPIEDNLIKQIDKLLMRLIDAKQANGKSMVETVEVRMSFEGIVKRFRKFLELDSIKGHYEARAILEMLNEDKL